MHELFDGCKTVAFFELHMYIAISYRVRVSGPPPHITIAIVFAS